MAQGKYYKCRHPDCIYKGTGRPGNFHGGCDYALITGRCRSTQEGGERAERCQLYISRHDDKKAKMQRDSGHPVWEPLAIGLLRAGYSLPAIANAAGVELAVIERWAAKREAIQKAKIIEPRRLIERGPHFDWDGEARKLWAEGKTDEEVAQIMGCALSYAGKMRRKLGIECKQKRGTPMSKRPPEGILRALHSAGLNDEQLGRFAGVSCVTVGKWRRELGLASNGKLIKNLEKARAIYDSIMEGEKHEQS